MFPLSLTGAAFNCFTSLSPNSIDSWASLLQKFHDYFYNREVELRLSDLTSLRQKYTETIFDYLKRFRGVRNSCYNLTIAEKDLADLAFAGLTPYLKDKLDGQEFSDTNQLSYPVFMPKLSTHCMHDPGSNVPYIWLKVLTDNQMS
jgi:hypothetical protein